LAQSTSSDKSVKTKPISGFQKYKHTDSYSA